MTVIKIEKLISATTNSNTPQSLVEFLNSVMLYETISTIARLLWTISNICPQYQEYILINELNDYYKFDHNIFLLGSSVDPDRFVNLSFIATKQFKSTPQSLYVFEDGRNNIKGLETLTAAIKSKNTFLIVSPDQANFNENLILLTQIKEIQRLNINMKIGVFFSDTISIDDLKKLLEWCWKQRIINIFTAFDSRGNAAQLRIADHFLNIFRFNIFESFDVINVTGSELFKKVFPSETLNFQQYPLRLANTASPSDKKLWLTVLQVLNSSLVAVKVDREADVSELFRDDIIDILPSTVLIDADRPLSTYLYPMVAITVVMVVPEALPYATFTTYLRAIATDHFFGFLLTTILATVFVLTIFRYIKARKMFFFQSAADVLNVLLVNDNYNIEYQRLSRVEAFIMIPLTFGGFIIVNIILSIFQSYLTRPYVQSEIETIEDLYRSPFPIFTNSEYWKAKATELLTVLWEHGNWSEKVHLIDYLEFHRQLYSYNTSRSFPFAKTQAKHLIKLQKQLNIRGYHISSEVRLLKTLAAYNLMDDFPFTERLNQIIHRVQNAGLYEKWLEEDDQSLLKIVRLVNSRGTSKNLDIDKFPLLDFIVYGWIAACVMFVFELIWKKVQIRKIMRRVCEN